MYIFSVFFSDARSHTKKYQLHFQVRELNYSAKQPPRNLYEWMFPLKSQWIWDFPPPFQTGFVSGVVNTCLEEKSSKDWISLATEEGFLLFLFCIRSVHSIPKALASEGN